MDPDDFGETSPNHQQIWINELAIRNRSVTEKNLAVDNYLATNSAEGIAFPARYATANPVLTSTRKRCIM